MLYIILVYKKGPYKLNITYCYEQCPVGRAASEEFLNTNNSVFGAAMEFQYFTENCFNTCPNKQVNINYNKDKES